MAQPPSSEGAQERSPQRKPWVRAQEKIPAPEGRKRTQSNKLSAAPLESESKQLQESRLCKLRK
jgi:hypothetical protein